MKTNKCTDETNITPSKKKLKQARLPFKLISDVSPSPVSSQTRKRKLSTSEAETASKLGKVCKENDLVDETVVISDDDSKDCSKPQKDAKLMNPYVKLVDTVWKKKQQKTKLAKKKKDGKKKNVTNGSLHNEITDTADEKFSEDVEMMDVDESNNQENGNVQRNNMTKESVSSDKRISDTIVILDGSTDSSDVKLKTDVENRDEQPIDINKNDNESPSECDKKGKSLQSKNTLESSQLPTNSKSHATDIEVEVEHSSSKIETECIANGERCVSSSDRDDQKEVENREDNNVSEKKDEKNTALENSVTPKRSTRSKCSMEQNSNTKRSPSTSKLNESSSSNTLTSNNNKTLPASNEELNDSLNESLTSVKKLTPRQLQKKQEAAKRKEERDRERLELEKKRQQEKDERAKQKHEKEEQRKREREEKEEQKKREKEEKEEQRKKEREEKEKQKELERKLKEEKEELKKKEKEEKEEQKRKEKEAREEEKRKKQETLEIAKQAFVNFFVPKQKSEKDQTTVGYFSKNDMLSNFTIKADMRLAPTKRVHLSDDRIQELDNFLKDQTNTDIVLYLKSLKEGTMKPHSCGKTWPKSDKEDDDVLIIEDDELLPIGDATGEFMCESAPREKLRPKLLSFHENRRPPYWGTWRKKSSSIKPRKPFGQDEKQLDYEVDSDDEWEEEQEGESIDGSAAGSDDEPDADEYEVDNEVFVPHGYLSDEEATMDDDDVLSLTPEAQKARLKHLEDEFESEMKKPTEKLKPRMYGLVWQTVDGDKPIKCVDALWDYFGKFAMIMDDSTVILQPTKEVDETEKKKVKKKKSMNNENGEQKSPKTDKKKKPKLDDKETKSLKKDSKKVVQENKNQPSINVFLNKLKSP